MLIIGLPARQVAEELRVRFRKYLTAASPHDQFMAVMDKLFRAGGRAASVRLNYYYYYDFYHYY